MNPIHRRFPALVAAGMTPLRKYTEILGTIPLRLNHSGFVSFRKLDCSIFNRAFQNDLTPKTDDFLVVLGLVVLIMVADRW